MKKQAFSAFSIFTALFICSGLVSCSEDDEGSRTVAPPDPIEFAVSPTSIDFEAMGGENTFEVTSGDAWTVLSDADWLSLSTESGLETSDVVVTAEANGETEERTAILTISTEDDTQDILITQAAAEAPPVEATIPPDETDMRALTSVELANEIEIGWNLGNSLDAIGGETAWGNPVVNEQLIQSVKEAGFNAIRIPVAWSKFSDEENFVITEDWMNRVEEVVNLVLDNDMYAIVNIHWDNGWMQPTYDDEEYVNNRLEIMWQQIAINFRDYGDRLLFAGTNEVMVEGDYGTPTEEYYTVQNGFNQTFVDAVRATGGRNHYRHLVVQGFNTNIDHTINFAEIPEDVVDDRLMMEIHYYDPYNFTLNTESNVYQWGDDASESEDWANESYVDDQFDRMKTEFIDNGIGVILGEYGAISRPNVDGHEQYRQYYMEYVTTSAMEHGLVPFYWDNGDDNANGFALFDRETGEVLYPDLLDAIIPGEE
ncbi:cellulase family glycosylhydrolase [Autumnicola psychrophila]|uniref:Cellulase family glycosylhydrolase n=1 Tax=Autumnicola psychrophila TaxID=3075592 RepID=A0ABU3DNX2_9FLAO|nr:cellulase family glycosylhydrolase [Zunongwangia sp. F225]MDT0685412.1 cellulase family glycosylhydrolase [Zunongwangia sp. F225]